MERDDEVKGEGNSYDFGARMYDSRLGRWLSIDKLYDKYPMMAPYNFAANSPIQAFDPDGNLIIFINGYNASDVATSGAVSIVTPGWSSAMRAASKSSAESAEQAYNSISQDDGGSANSDYWGKFEGNVKTAWNDKNAMYVDGSPGLLVDNINDIYRVKVGQQQGYQDASSILSQLSEGETIKIVTHSMGGAFGRGYVDGLQKGLENEVKRHNAQVQRNMETARQNGIPYNGPALMAVPKIEVVLDVAPYGSNIPAHSNVPTYQASGDKDDISGTETWMGAIKVPTKPGTGHGISDYKDIEIPSLQASEPKN
jgi:RHS repeat-associated protein